MYIILSVDILCYFGPQYCVTNNAKEYLEPQRNQAIQQTRKAVIRLSGIKRKLQSVGGLNEQQLGFTGST